MKANNRRKVFGDAVDLLMEDIEEKTAPGGLRMLSIKKIRPFHDHPFHLYEGERLEDMVGRLLKLNDLIKPFKDMVDRGALYTKVALQLAFLPEEEQDMVFRVMNEEKTKITSEMVANLRSHSGSLTEAKIKRYLSKNPIKKKCYKVPARIVEKYFEGMDPNTVDSIVEQALAAWFGKENADV